MCAGRGRTASPVPRASSWTASSTPSGRCGSSARSGPPTTTIRPAPAARAAAIGHSTIGRPQSSCSTFGRRRAHPGALAGGHDHDGGRGHGRPHPGTDGTIVRGIKENLKVPIALTHPGRGMMRRRPRGHRPQACLSTSNTGSASRSFVCPTLRQAGRRSERRFLHLGGDHPGPWPRRSRGDMGSAGCLVTARHVVEAARSTAPSASVEPPGFRRNQT